MDSFHVTISYLQETHFKCNKYRQIKTKRMKKIHHANTNQKKDGMGIYYQTKETSKQAKLTKNKEGYIILKELTKKI